MRSHTQCLELIGMSKSFVVMVDVCWLKCFLTHWGRVTHICVDNLTVIGSDNSLSPGWRQAIIWTNDRILFIGPSGTNFSEVFIEIHAFSLKKMHLKMSSGKWWPFCPGLNVLIMYKQLLSVLFISVGLACYSEEVCGPVRQCPGFPLSAENKDASSKHWDTYRIKKTLFLIRFHASLLCHDMEKT